MDTEFITIGQKEQFQQKYGVYRYDCRKYIGTFYDYFAADIIGKSGPALIIITILICIPNIFNGATSIRGGMHLAPGLDIIKAADSWLLSVFNYLGFGSSGWYLSCLPIEKFWIVPVRLL